MNKELNKEQEKLYSKYKSDIYKAINSENPLSNEILKKIYWLDILLFDNNALAGVIDIDYVKDVTDLLEIYSDYGIKASRSYITYHIPATCNIAEDLSPTNYFIIGDRDNYFFRIYSNNTIDINHRAFVSKSDKANNGNIRECFIFLISILCILKHLQLFNRYVDYSKRIHWNYNKPTDNITQYLQNVNAIQDDYLNIIFDSENIMDYNLNFNFLIHTNSIRSFKFLFSLNNENRREFALSYGEATTGSRGKLFKAIYTIIVGKVKNSYIEHVFNSIFFSKVEFFGGIEIPIRLIIVSKKEINRIRFKIVKYEKNSYMFVAANNTKSFFIDTATGLLVRNEKLINTLNHIKQTEREKASERR